MLGLHSIDARLHCTYRHFIGFRQRMPAIRVKKLGVILNSY